MSLKELYKRSLIENILEIPVNLFFIVMGVFSLMLAAYCGYLIGLYIGLWEPVSGNMPKSVISPLIGGLALLVLTFFLLRSPVRWFLDWIYPTQFIEGVITVKNESRITSSKGAVQTTYRLTVGDTNFDISRRTFDAVEAKMNVRLQFRRWSKVVTRISMLEE